MKMDVSALVMRELEEIARRLEKKNNALAIERRGEKPFLLAC